MDAFLTIIFWIVSAGMAGLGVFVSLKPQPKEKHKSYIVAFLVLFVLGGAINTIQTLRNNHAQDALIKDITELKGGQQETNKGITRVGGDVAKLEKNTQQPPQISFNPTINVPSSGPQHRFNNGFMQVRDVSFGEIRVGLPLIPKMTIQNRGIEPVENMYKFYSFAVGESQDFSKFDVEIHKRFLKSAQNAYRQLRKDKVGGHTVGVNEVIGSSIDPTPPLSQPGVDAILQGKKRIYMYAWATWKNARSNLDSCMWYKIGEGWHLCTESL